MNAALNQQDKVYWLIVALGFAALFIPTYYDLSRTLWATDEQGHGPIILFVSFFLFWQKRSELKPQKTSTLNDTLAFLLLSISALIYLLGRTQQVQIFEVGSQIPILAAILALTIGFCSLRKFWFPLLFLLAMVPLPGSVVDALTLPMKIAVSGFSESILYHLGYPIAREGVIIQISQYKLLVADACAGLHTVFTLEAMGLLYLHLIKRDSFRRNLILALLILPISFFANSVRVIALILITYYFGDEVGQGFVHNFASFVLFGIALILIIGIDWLIQYLEGHSTAAKKEFTEA